jgi:hypothetical protein
VVHLCFHSQEDVTYKPLPQEHYAKRHCAHLVVLDPIPMRQQLTKPNV